MCEEQIQESTSADVSQSDEIAALKESIKKLEKKNYELIGKIQKTKDLPEDYEELQEFKRNAEQSKLEQEGKYVDQLEKLTVYDHTLSPNIKPPRFNKVPFKKIKLPDELYTDLYNQYSNLEFEPTCEKMQEHPEWGKTISGISNIKTNPYAGYGGLSNDFIGKAFNILTPIMEEWCGMDLLPTVSYGIRSYPDGSVLNLHRDQIRSHVLSCIIYVDRK